MTRADLPFSSGTTGVAKGVAVTHANMTSAIQAGVINPLYAEGHSAVTIGCIPFYHACQPPSSVPAIPYSKLSH